MYYTQIIPLEVALKLTELYHEECDHHYNTRCGRKPFHNFPAEDWNYDCDHFVSAPTYAEVFDWLIDKGLIVKIENPRRDVWRAEIHRVKAERHYDSESGATWHEAADNAIREAIHLLQ